MLIPTLPRLDQLYQGQTLRCGDKRGQRGRAPGNTKTTQALSLSSWSKRARTRLHRNPERRAWLPFPGAGFGSIRTLATLCPALGGYQRHLLKQMHPLQTHSRPDTSRLYIETGFACLTPAVPISARPAHTALIRRPGAPWPPPPDTRPFCSRRKRHAVPAPERLNEVNVKKRFPRNLVLQEEGAGGQERKALFVASSKSALGDPGGTPGKAAVNREHPAPGLEDA
jgi:hypothetical protein